MNVLLLLGKPDISHAETCSNILENFTCVKHKTSMLTSTDNSSALTTSTTDREQMVIHTYKSIIQKTNHLPECSWDVLDIYCVPQYSVLSMGLRDL